MCMADNTKDTCILLERMAKVEAKQWLLIAITGAMFLVMSLITFKLLDSQIYLLSGEKGLEAISDEAHEDVRIIRRTIKAGGGK